MLEQLAVQHIHVVTVVLGSLGRGLGIAIGRGLVLDGHLGLSGRSGLRRLRDKRGSHGLRSSLSLRGRLDSLSLRGRHGFPYRHSSLHRRIHINRGNFPQIVVMAIKHRAHS